MYRFFMNSMLGVVGFLNILNIVMIWFSLALDFLMFVNVFSYSECGLFALSLRGILGEMVL